MRENRNPDLKPSLDRMKLRNDRCNMEVEDRLWYLHIIPWRLLWLILGQKVFRGWCEESWFEYILNSNVNSLIFVNLIRVISFTSSWLFHMVWVFIFGNSGTCLFSVFVIFLSYWYITCLFVLSFVNIVKFVVGS